MSRLVPGLGGAGEPSTASDGAWCSGRGRGGARATGSGGLSAEGCRDIGPVSVSTPRGGPAAVVRAQRGGRVRRRSISASEKTNHPPAVICRCGRRVSRIERTATRGKEDGQMTVVSATDLATVDALSHRPPHEGLASASATFALTLPAPTQDGRRGGVPPTAVDGGALAKERTGAGKHGVSSGAWVRASAAESAAPIDAPVDAVRPAPGVERMVRTPPTLVPTTRRSATD